MVVKIIAVSRSGPPLDPVENRLSKKQRRKFQNMESRGGLNLGQYNNIEAIVRILNKLLKMY